MSELQDRLEVFKHAVDDSFTHIIITDENGIIVYANKSVERITGYTAEEIIGQKPSLWGRQMPSEFYENLWDTIKNQKASYTGQVTNRRKNGQIYYAKVVISPILSLSGVLIGFIGMEDDITEMKMQQIKLEEENKELENMTKILVGREIKMTELKEKIKSLEEQLKAKS